MEFLCFYPLKVELCSLDEKNSWKEGDMRGKGKGEGSLRGRRCSEHRNTAKKKK